MSDQWYWIQHQNGCWISSPDTIPFKNKKYWVRFAPCRETPPVKLESWPGSRIDPARERQVKARKTRNAIMRALTGWSLDDLVIRHERHVIASTPVTIKVQP